MAFDSDQVTVAAAEAQRALDEGDQVLVTRWRVKGTILGGGAVTSGGTLLEIGACIEAVEEPGWRLHSLTPTEDAGGTTHVYCVFRRDLR